MEAGFTNVREGIELVAVWISARRGILEVPVLYTEEVGTRGGLLMTADDDALLRGAIDVRSGVGHFRYRTVLAFSSEKGLGGGCDAHDSREAVAPHP